jgi:hypothetical protein
MRVHVNIDFPFTMIEEIDIQGECIRISTRESYARIYLCRIVYVEDILI